MRGLKRGDERDISNGGGGRRGEKKQSVRNVTPRKVNALPARCSLRVMQPSASNRSSPSPQPPSPSQDFSDRVANPSNPPTPRNSWRERKKKKKNALIRLRLGCKFPSSFFPFPPSLGNDPISRPFEDLKIYIVSTLVYEKVCSKKV